MLVWLLGGLVLLAMVAGLVLRLFARGAKDTTQTVMVAAAASWSGKVRLRDVGGITGVEWHDITGRLTQVGRQPGVDSVNVKFLCLDDDLVSREHAFIEQRADGYWVRDRGSANGTFVNDSKVQQEQRLQDGDRLRFARFEFVFSLLRESDQAQTVVAPALDSDAATMVLPVAEPSPDIAGQEDEHTVVRPVPGADAPVAPPEAASAPDVSTDSPETDPDASTEETVFRPRT